MKGKEREREMSLGRKVGCRKSEEMKAASRNRKALLCM